MNQTAFAFPDNTIMPAVPGTRKGRSGADFLARYPCGSEESLLAKITKEVPRYIRNMDINAEARRRIAALPPLGEGADPEALFKHAQRRAEIHQELELTQPFRRVTEDDCIAAIYMAAAIYHTAHEGEGERGPSVLEGSHAVSSSPFEDGTGNGECYLDHSRDISKAVPQIIALVIGMAPEEEVEVRARHRAQVVEKMTYLVNKISSDLERGWSIVYAPILGAINGMVHFPLDRYEATFGSSDGRAMKVDEDNEEDLLTKYMGPKGTRKWKARMSELVIQIFVRGMMLELEPVRPGAQRNLVLVNRPDNKDHMTRRLLPGILGRRIGRIRAQIQTTTNLVSRRGYAAAIRYYNQVINLLENEFDDLEFADAEDREGLMTIVYATYDMAEKAENHALMGKVFTLPHPSMETYTVGTFAPIQEAAVAATSASTTGADEEMV